MAEIKETVTIGRALPSDMPAILKQSIKVFFGEQKIPAELVPVKEELQPRWWVAKLDGQLVGACAAWQEEGACHWGRFAINPALRGKGIGKRLARRSFEDLFASGIPEVFSEARDATAHILKNWNCEILGETTLFFGEPITPLVLRKADFEKVWCK